MAYSIGTRETKETAIDIVNVVLGLCLVLAPWFLGFATVAAARYAHVVIGLIVGALAALDLWMIRNRPVLRA